MEEWEMDMGMQAEVDDESVIDHCGTVFGTYTGALDYSFSLTGIPTEDIGLDAGELDIELSDSITESGTFEDTITGDEMEFSMGDALTVDLGDGAGLTTSVAACTDCPPGNPLMFFMMGQVIGGASESFAESVAEDVADELSDSILDIFGDDVQKNTMNLAATNGNAIAATNGSTNGKSMTATTIATTALMRWTCPVPGAVRATTFT